MSRHPTDLTEAQAQALMSQLLDGELSPSDAERLDAYLEIHPEAADWMEGLDLQRDSSTVSQFETESAVASISAAIDKESEADKRDIPLLAFPKFFRGIVAAAAAIAVTAGITWMAVNPSANTHASVPPATVEFVATDIPDASIWVNADDESGWTVVWVENIEPTPPAAKHG